LAQDFIHRRRHSQGLPELAISAAAGERLCAYAWPGNVRELRNVIERAIILVGAGDAIGVDHLTSLTQGPQSRVAGLNGVSHAALAGPLPNSPPLSLHGGIVGPHPMPNALVFQGEPTLEAIERDYLVILLKRYKGNRSKIARVLGVSERTAYRMMDRHGMD
jgi:DNA-binding NtrC family response regulator